MRRVPFALARSAEIWTVGAALRASSAGPTRHGKNGGGWLSVFGGKTTRTAFGHRLS